MATTLASAEPTHLGSETRMTEVRRTIHADPDAVWDALADPETYPRWLVGAQVIRGVDADFPAPGSDFQHKVGATDEAAVPDSTTALEAERPHRLALKVRARPFFEGVVRFRLLPVRVGTELAMEEEPTGPLRVLAPLLRPLVVARNAKSLDQLRELVESRTSGSSSPR
jgi:uncharacterized protein YndB with AHSA1/START domain